MKRAAFGGGVLLLAGRNAVAAAKAEEKEEDVSPTEDLMREHGVLRRILLVYAEACRRLDGGEAIKPEPLVHGAEIIRAFIEDYHEKDEEEFVFPRLLKAGKHVDLVQVLIQQHQVGRKVTATILRLATPSSVASQTGRSDLARAMRSFSQMYEAHAAREDTVIFPAFRELLSEKELDKLMDVFEDKEKALPMGDFEKMVSEVAKLERAFGIDDLAKLTPKP